MLLLGVKEEVIDFNNLGNKIINKEFLLQFLPECFDDIKDSKNIIYKEQKIKTSYLIDILNSLILKYYFKKENRFSLNATILKDRYGHLYNYYINYLIDSNILILLNNYKKGVSSRVYSINPSIFNSKINRYKNYDKVLIKKYKKKVFDTIDIKSDIYNSIRIDVKEKLISDLFEVDIDLDRSLFFLNNIKDKDLDIYNKNLYSVECINNKHIFYHFDDYGRMHTNFTILKSFIRKNCLLIDGEETSEIDISNSQPLFLSKLINESQTNWVNHDEFDLFKKLTINGKYYDYLISNLGIKEKSDAKKLTYKVLFGRNSDNNKADKMFRKLFPSIHNFIRLYKIENGNYKILAYDLQRMESNLIFNKIVSKIMYLNPDIKIITIHDSIIVPSKWGNIAENIFKNELLNEFNF